MNQTTSLPYDWLKAIPTSLLQQDEIPLIGFPPPFPWEKFSEEIGKVFQLPQVKIEHNDLKWLEAGDLLSGLGESIIPLQLNIPSLDGTLHWVMPESDLRLLMALLLTKEKSDDIHFIDKEFLMGFYHFIAYETIGILDKLPFDKTLAPHLAETGELPRKSSLCMDIRISVKEKVMNGRFIVSPEMRKSWKERYAERSLNLPINQTLAEKLFIEVHLEAGKTSLQLSEWKKVIPGDFLLLDTCSVIPGDDKSRVMLTVNGTPFFRARLKQNNLKLIEHPLYYEGEADMAKKPFESEDEDLTSDSELEDFSDSEFEDTTEESDVESFTEDETLEESSVPETSEEVEANAEESYVEEDEKSQENGEEEVEKPVQASQQSASPLNVEDFPLSIIVEVGRLQMSIQKIMDLQPGNMLELDVRPENGVDLVVNGRRIAKGELIKIGESLGVRILDIG